MRPNTYRRRQAFAVIFRPLQISGGDGSHLQSYEGDRKYRQAMAGIFSRLQAIPNTRRHRQEFAKIPPVAGRHPRNLQEQAVIYKAYRLPQT
jgi:hypothetical protein